MENNKTESLSLDGTPISTFNSLFGFDVATAERFSEKSHSLVLFFYTGRNPRQQKSTRRRLLFCLLSRQNIVAGLASDIV